MRVSRCASGVGRTLRGRTSIAVAAGLLLPLAAACAARGRDLREAGGSAQAGVAAAEPVQHPRAVDDACKAGAPRPRLESSQPPKWLAGEEHHGSCRSDGPSDDPAQDSSDEVRLDGERFRLRALGPSGSGRHWEVLVSWPGAAGTRGFCFSTSSGGWRQIGADARLANAIAPLIRWWQDVDGDARPELVVRSTLELEPGASLDRVAVSAAAYDRDGDGFVLDPGSTRTLRANLARAYRAAAQHPETPSTLRAHCEVAAERLFQAASCAR